MMRFAAIAVHLFTASGLLAGFMAILAINDRNWRAAMAWLLLALLIDGIDGTLARKFKINEVLPNISGKNIDNVVDFVNYAVVPAYFFYMIGLAGPVWSLPLALLILLVSALYYGKEGMVSDDFYFVGFPVMWNIVIFYLVFVFYGSPDSLSTCQLSIASCPLPASIVIVFAILHFVPVKFAYPSRATRFKTPTLIATAAILVIIPAAVWSYPDVPVWLKWFAILNLGYFGVLAVYDTLRNPQ